MNIQKTNNVNFEAKRILNVRRALQNGADEVIDVFALGREDKKFMARCNDLLQKTDRVAISSHASNINYLGGSADKGYKDFFRDFLLRHSGKHSAYMQEFDDVHCYVAIKDGEMISAIGEVSNADFPTACLDRMIFQKKDKMLADSFFYGMLTDLKNIFKREGQTGLRGVNRNMTKKVDDNGVLDLNFFGQTQRTLARKNNDIEINRVNDTYQYDLEDFLGVKDIETEIMD